MVPTPEMLPPPNLQPFCLLTVELGDVIELGTGRGAHRRIIPITGGQVEGEFIHGEILNVGADWQSVFEDGLAQLDTRYAMRTFDGAVIEIINFGFRHGPKDVLERLIHGKEVQTDEYYMRTIARLETGNPKYDWVNRMVFVGTGQRRKNSVEISLYSVN